MAHPQMIQFTRPVFPPVGEIFVTCRQGTKWGRYGGRVDLGDTVYFVETGIEHAVLGAGELLARFEGHLRDIPASWLKREHDESCRDHEGLLHEMIRVYGEYEDDFHTVALMFVRTR